MRDIAVAGRYAHALFIISERRKESPTALDDLKSVRDLVTPGSPASSFLAAPQIRMADKRKLLATALEGRVVLSVSAFIDLLLRKHRLVLLDAITGHFQERVERSQGIRRAHVVSAIPLAESELSRLLASLEHYTKSHIKLTAEVDVSVLGGALVRIGDRVVDRTVRTLLESIGAQLREVRV